MALALVAVPAGLGAGPRGQATSPPPPDDGVEIAPRAAVALPGLLDASDEPIAPDPAVRSGTLANGLRYHVRHNDQPGGKAELRLAIAAGAVHETGPNTGVAHFVEHMLFNGTARYPENELIDVLSRFGAQFGADVNASTSFDETVYQLSVPNDDASVDTGLDVLHEWLTAATFDPAQVEAERGVVLDEWRRRTQTAQGRLLELAAGMYLAGTPYEDRLPIGTAESIAAVPVEELRAFYDAWYRPDNAAVVVVGDIDVDAVAAAIEERFAAAQPRTDEPPKPPVTAMPIDQEPDAALHVDPDQRTVDVEVTLPLPAETSTGTAGLRTQLLDSMIFDILIRRLTADAASGDAPFDDVTRGTNSFVDALDAPALYAFTDAERVRTTLQALLDEYERASRYGFSEREVAIARSGVQATFDAMAERADSTPDRSFADRIVAHVLTGAAMPSPGELHAVVSAELEAMSPAALDLRFRARWDNSAPHVIISAPSAVASDLPDEDDVLAMIAELPGRLIEPRADAADAPDALMTVPEPVAPVSEGPAPGGDAGVYPAFELVFANGARVVAAPTDIAAGTVAFEAASPGGTAVVADDDVIDARYAADIVTSSGVGPVDQQQLEAYLAGHSAALGAWLTPYSEHFAGHAAASDLETLFQLVHLYMTEPRVDPVALTQVRRGTQPLVDDPATSPQAAAADALNAARYGDELRYDTIPSPADFATLDLDGVERVWRERFGDAGDWVFAFAGDIDPDVLRDLAARYIGTLPGTARPAEHADLGLVPPDGVVADTVRAGTGDTAAVTLAFVSPVDRRDARLEATVDLVERVVDDRLLAVVREELGESYSPRASIAVTNDPGPVIETTVQVSGAPDRIHSVADVVVAELADLATAGPTPEEFGAAYAQVAEGYRFADNGDVLDAMLGAALDPAGAAADFLDRFRALPAVTAADVRAFLADHVTVDRHIRIVVEPR